MKGLYPCLKLYLCITLPLSHKIRVLDNPPAFMTNHNDAAVPPPIFLPLLPCWVPPHWSQALLPNPCHGSVIFSVVLWKAANLLHHLVLTQKGGHFGSGHNELLLLWNGTCFWYGSMQPIYCIRTQRNRLASSPFRMWSRRFWGCFFCHFVYPVLAMGYSLVVTVATCC